MADMQGRGWRTYPDLLLAPGCKPIDCPHFAEHGSVRQREAQRQDPGAHLAQRAISRLIHVSPIQSLQVNARQTDDAPDEHE